ncbi:MAG: hypothetical protein AAGB24_15820 [Bacteroidota bacterium]
MKTVLKFTVVMAIMLGATASLANKSEKILGKKVSEVEERILTFDLDPVFIKKGDKLLMNLLNLDGEKVVIRVFDSEGRLLFSETIKNDLVVEKAFNFEKAYSDNYTVQVIDNKKTFEEKVVVK